MIFILRMMRSRWKILNRGVKRFDVVSNESVVWRRGQNESRKMIRRIFLFR